MYYGGEQNVPGAPGNVGTYQNMFAGLNLPLGGRLNRGGDLREQTRPGGQTETLPTRPMLPSEYTPGAIDVQFRQAMGLPGAMQIGNMAGLSDQLQARNQGPSTPVKYDDNMNMFVPNMGGGRPANIRPKGSAALPPLLASLPNGFSNKYVS